MFAQWKFMRLRAAERCLADGRLDEAFERLDAQDLRRGGDNARAQKLVGMLTNALKARARLHLQAGRYPDAIGDLDRVEALGATDDEARLLRRRAGGELEQRVQRQAGDQAAVRRVEHDLAAGRLESGRAALEQVADDGRREELREQLDMRLRRSEELIEQATAALDAQDALGAWRIWNEACRRHGRTAAGDQLAARIAASLAKLAAQAYRDGRLERLLTLSRSLHETAAFNPLISETEALIRLVERAGRQLAANDFDELRETLLRLRGRSESASWVSDLLNCVDRLSAARGELLASPLGALGVSLYGDPRGERKTNEREAVPASPSGDLAALPANGLLMLIDGTGSILVLGDPLVRIGRAGGEARIHVPLPADVQSHHADVACDGEAYFLAARGPTQVNGRTVQRVLLRDGDRVSLGDSARITFTQPSARSASATLKISDRCRLPQDVDRVVLLRDTFTIGPAPSDHVMTREGDGRVVVYLRDGALHAHRVGRDGRPNGPSQALRLNATQELGDLRVTLKAYDGGGLTRRA